jgi:tetratricopeptide (TPR) repeat protein
MEILKKTILTAVMVITAANFVCAQSFDELENAFKESYRYEKEGKYGKAIEALQRVYNKDNYEINLRLGWLKYSAGLFSEALPYYEKCIALKPLSIEARLGIVNPAAAMGNWTQVEKQYLDILKIDPHNSQVNYRLGLIYYGREDYQKAVKYFSKVVNHYPFDYDGVIMLAWTNLKLKKYREAEVLFHKALLFNPYDVSAKEGLDALK